LATAAIVVHYRTPQILGACLASLHRQTVPPGEIVVVDNSGAVEAAPDPPTGAGWTLVRSPVNSGYGSACNRGAGVTSGETLIFLNADLTLEADACEQLERCATAHSAAALFGPRIYGADGEIELSARSFPTLRTGVLGRSSFLTRVLRSATGAPRSVGMALGGVTREVDWVSGACMLARRSAFEQVGGFDEGYWMYWEDADLCHRLHDQGLETMICIDAVAHHETGSSGRSRESVSAFHDSAARYYSRHVARGSASAALARMLLEGRKRVVLARLDRDERGRQRV
jgi:GT2 family glycosyltransferase